MSIFDRLNRKKSPAPVINREILNGSLGGVIPRVTPTLVNPVNRAVPYIKPGGGVSTPIADRPNNAAMLKSANYYTQIPGIGVLMGMPTTSFRRGSPAVHSAAVSDVTHVRPTIGVHPTVVRQVRRGNGSL